MKNPITTLHIQNFKTIKDLKVKCKRINIIIGKPNVGKSNFLEALSLLGANYSYTGNILKAFVRFDNFEDIYYDKEIENPILIDSNIAHGEITQYNNGEYFEYKLHFGIDKKTKLKDDNLSLQNVEKIGKTTPRPAFYTLTITIARNGDIKSKGKSPIFEKTLVKKYEFLRGKPYNTSRSSEFLNTPYGDNLYTIINSYKNKPNGVFKEIADFFKEYKLQFAIRQNDTTFEVQKKVKSVVYPFAYDLIADTLQRMIFNIAAIESNKESILLFEEPEAHSFPLYAQRFADKVIESKTNQFFITTHSPFVLNEIIEKSFKNKDVAIFIATYDKFQTKLTELTEKQIRDMLDYGNDIFFSPQVLD